MDFYQTLLEEELKPGVARLKAADPPVLCTKFLHDAVTGRSSHEPIYPVLEEIFGKNGFFENAHPPCKFLTGEVKIVKCRSKKTGKEWDRRYKVKADCDPCECKHSNDYPAFSPELNPAELAQNHLKYNVLPELLREEGIEWSGSVEEKMDILSRAIIKLDADKEWFRKTFASLRRKYKWVAENNGEIWRK